MTFRVLLAGLFHETHTFLEGRTSRGEFHERLGDELLAARGDGSPLAGILEVAHEHRWSVVPTIDLRATPGPIVADEVVDRFWSVVSEALTRELATGLDGIALVLHGAMVSESLLDVEGELLARIAAVTGGRVPVCGVLDLHGNISPLMARHSDGLVAYRENPHADAASAAADGARILHRLMARRARAVTVFQPSDIIWPPTGTGTAFEPMRALEARARDLERQHPEILAVNVFAGFAYADTPNTGVSFSACTTGDPALVRPLLEQLAQQAWLNREAGNVRELPLSQVLRELRAAQGATGATGAGPVVLAEPSDNIGGGAPGDGTALLKALLEHGIQNAAVAINDPQAVATLERFNVGDEISLMLGGRGSPLSGGPARLTVELLRLGDGDFRLEDPHSHLASMCGDHFDMGRCAVVRTGGVTILITTHKTAPFDLGQWRSQGLVPETFAVIGVKAAVAHRKVYDPIARAHFTVETPGPCSSHLAAFPFKNVRRPVYPLD